MKHLLIVLCLGLALAVHASARLVVPSLSEAVTPDAAINRDTNNCVLCFVFLPGELPLWYNMLVFRNFTRRVN